MSYQIFKQIKKVILADDSCLMFLHSKNDTGYKSSRKDKLKGQINIDPKIRDTKQLKIMVYIKCGAVWYPPLATLVTIISFVSLH